MRHSAFYRSFQWENLQQLGAVVYKKAHDWVVAQAKGQTVCSFVWQAGSALESVGKPLLEGKKENVSKTSKHKCFGAAGIAEGICGGSACGAGGERTANIFAARVHIAQMSPIPTGQCPPPVFVCLGKWFVHVGPSGLRANAVSAPERSVPGSNWE